MWKEYINADQLDLVLDILDQKKAEARVVAGGTDLILELERGVRKGITTLIDVSRMGTQWDRITLDEDNLIHIGPLVTHNQCAASKLLQEKAYPLARACWEVGSPQIRNRGTIAGNIITGSPANDTISPLLVLDAQVVLQSKKRGKRTIPLEKFHTGVRKTVMEADEMLVDIYFPALTPDFSGSFVKFALRRAQAISLVNLAMAVNIQNGIIQEARIAIGAVTPIVCRVKEAEAWLVGKKVSDQAAIKTAGEQVVAAATPISDVRSSNPYRKHILEVITGRALEQCFNNVKDLPEYPVLLMGAKRKNKSLQQSNSFQENHPIRTRVNGKEYVVTTGQEKTLLRLLREDIGLIGTKEGCAEGECGACTVFLDGIAVMACMVPAPRADNAEIVTIEGIGTEEVLHPVQQAFIDDGAVQCGYCTPGFVMSAVKLLEENPKPSTDEVKQAITGNLCRCTGYYKIVQAIEDAAVMMQEGVS